MFKKYLMAASLISLLPINIAMADTKYICKHHSSTRTIEVHYVNPDSQVPCEVIYTRESGEPKVVWNAQAETGYCEARAKDFVAKQEGWGWSCAEESGEMSEPSAE